MAFTSRRGARFRRGRVTKFRGQAKLNKRQVREVKQIIGRKFETKFASSYITNTGVTATPTIVDLTSAAGWNITQGTGEGKRIGDQIMLKSINLRWAALCGDNYNTTRVILFRWNGANSTAPVVTDILDNTGEEYVFAPYNLENHLKYHIIYDKTIALNNQYAFTSAGSLSSSLTQNAGSYKIVRPVNLVGKKLGKKAVTWDAGSASAGAGHVYIMYLSDSVVVPNVAFWYTAQARYIDA